MNILEAIQNNPVFANITVNTINTVLVSRSVIGSAEYDSNSVKDVELVSADLYHDIATLPKYKEGQLSLEYNPEALLKRAESIYRRYNDPKLDEFGATKIDVGISRV